jgi:hypothetical protein
MANTYTLQAVNIANANAKNILAVSNAAASGKIIKIYEVRNWNNQIATVTGGLCGLILGRCSAVHSGGTALTFFRHGTAATAGSTTPFTGISAASGTTTITATMATEFRRVFRVTEEWAASEVTFDAIQNVYPWQVLWDTGIGDSNVEPFIIREGECFLIKTDAAPANANGAIHLSVMLTIE